MGLTGYYIRDRALPIADCAAAGEKFKLEPGAVVDLLSGYKVSSEANPASNFGALKNPAPFFQQKSLLTLFENTSTDKSDHDAR